MEKEIQNIQHLLSQVTAINKKYEEIAEITGENFNVFKILGLTSNEVRTHSAFLAELLNPKGSHGCKDAFLKLFVEMLRVLIIDQTREINENDNQFLDRINEFTSSNKCTVVVEYHIGLINQDSTIGGRIDILLQDQNKNEIIIENKIYAGEQTNQLIRYYNYNSKAPILYLTLNGDSPSSIKDGNHELFQYKNYICISYEKDIIEWLELCRKESVGKPILRETITQYIYLIKHLTNQTINNKMKDEIINLATCSKQNLESVLSLEKITSNIKTKIQEIFWIDLEHLITEYLGSNYVINSNYSEKLKGYYLAQRISGYLYGGIYIDVLSISENEKIQFFIRVNQNVYYGFRIMINNEESKLNNKEEFKSYVERIQKKFKYENTEDYLAWSYTSFLHQLNFRNFNSDRIFELAEKESRQKIVGTIAMEVKKIVEEFQEEFNPRN